MKKLLLMCFMLVSVLLMGCENSMINKYNVKLYDNITESFSNTFVKEHITYGAYFEDIVYDDEKISKDYTISVNSQVEAMNVFDEIPFEINFEKQNIIIYIYTTKYSSARVELTKVVLDNNIFNLYIKENIGGIGTGSATIPTTKFIVVIADKIDQCHYNFII